MQNIKEDNGEAIDTLTTVLGAGWKMIHCEWVDGNSPNGLDNQDPDKMGFKLNRE